MDDKTADFIKAATAAHGDRYDYAKSAYVNARVKVTIICPEHGEFLQLPRKHVSGSKCKRCSNGHANDYRKMTVETFAERARTVHGDRYDYGSVQLNGVAGKVKISCAKHGEFEQKACSHLDGHGCPKCAKPGRRAPVTKPYDTAWFIGRAASVHPGFYDYSKTTYVNSVTPVVISCPKHGDFSQVPRDHLNGYGCGPCGLERLSVANSDSLEGFLAAATQIHGSTYDYSPVIYKNRLTKVKMTCKKHGEFLQSPKHHLRGRGCPACSESAGQRELFEYVAGLDSSAVGGDRSVISPMELDVIVPSSKLAIEFNGVWWHSDAFPNARQRHIRKLRAVEAAGWSLLQFWDSEWRDSPEIVKSMISHRLGASGRRTGARSLKLVIPTESEAASFFNHNHLKGHRPASSYLALADGDGVKCCASLSKVGDGAWELIRFAVECGLSVSGGMGKLFSAFVSANDPASVMSYADRRYSCGNLYSSLGFKLVSETVPNYYYVKGGRLYSRQRFQKHKLAGKLATFDQSKSEVENMSNNGYCRVWDAGNLKFEWSRPR